MAKKPDGYYSADAIIGRAKARAYEQQQAIEKTRVEKTEPPKPSSTTGVMGGSDFNIPVQPIEDVLTTTDNWDYKTAQTDLQGKPLETRKVGGFEIQPKGFDPNGNPYFGQGITAWLKKWAYKWGEESATDAEADKAWDSFYDSAKNFGEIVKDEFVGEDQSQDASIERAKQAGASFVSSVAQFVEASYKSASSKAADSPASSILTPVLKSANLAVGMTLEVFQEVSELPEQAMGAQRAMREYTADVGSFLPDIDFDDDTRPGQRQEAVDILTNLNPAVAAYNAARFWTAPGTFKEKTQAIKDGWTEGNMLYSELVDPTIREEYNQRVKSGEDPYLLTMELQNPWAELVGEMILDPLNVIGAFGKAKKAASTLEEAAKVIEKSGALGDAAFVEKIADIGKISDPAQASRKMEEIVDDVMRYSTREARRVDDMQTWKLKDLTPAGNRFRQHRVVGNFMANAVQAIRHTGGSPDDVLDYVVALMKRASNDRGAVKDAIATLSKSPLGNLSYNQSAFETGYILNKLMGDGDSLVKSIKAVNGNWNEMRKVLDDKIVKALDYSFPSVSDLVKAADKAAAGATDSKTVALAERFKELQKTNPGVVKWAKIEEGLKLTVGGLNGFLANNYFSLSYGYAFRNLMQNMVTLWADSGFSWKEGIFPKTERLDNFLIKQFGDIPQSLKGKTLTKSVTENSLMGKFFEKLNAWKYSPAALADWGETYAGKLIYTKYYKQTLDNAVQLGAALPDIATWERAGFSAEQAKDFVNLIKANDYDEVAAVAAFNTKYGSGSVDKWRMLDWVDPNVQKGLEEYEDFWQRIVKLTNDPDVMQENITDLFDDLKRTVRQNANKVNSEPVRMSHADPTWRQLADEAEQAGKFKNSAIDNKMAALKIQFDKAAAELNDALKNAVFHLKNDPNNADLVDEILEFTSDARRQMVNEKAVRQKEEVLGWVLDIRDKSKKTPALQLWDESILGARPENLDRDKLLDATWQYYFGKRESIWGAYFKAYTDKAMELANRTGMQDLFGQANKSLIELEQYRSYVYTPQGIFTKPVKFAASTVGDAANGQNVRKLAGAYGIHTATAEGKNLDKTLLDIINKYAPPKKPVAQLNDEAMQFAKKYNKATPPLDDPDFVNTVKRLGKENNIPEEDAGEILDRMVIKYNTYGTAERLLEKLGKKEVYRSLDDIPLDAAEQAIAKHSGYDVKGFFTKSGEPKPLTEGISVPPPRDPNSPPMGHVYSESRQGMLDALEHVKKGMVERWGLKVPARGDADAVKALTQNLTERMTIAKAKAQIVADQYRDFALLPYGETKNFDFALSLVYPYQFWYSRSYSNWMKRAFATNPEIISRYANLKDAMAQEQRDLPDWWKSQLNVSKLFGVETDNPVYINIEATLWPLYGLTGTDFNDPAKRTNWFTAMLDDMGKFGPSMWAPIQWAVAGAYAIQGEKDIASKWGTRAIPLTATIKAASSYIGTPIELDPNVQLFSGEGLFDFRAADPYEEGRISRALAAMSAEGIPEEQLLEAARTHSGPLWEEAYIRATQQRAPGQLMSFLFGVGFKARTKDDVETDRFYAEYGRMRNLHEAGYMTDAQYAQGFNELREKYPFMDVILLSRRAGMGRDAAYAYNVIGRIPPGMSSEIFEIIGVDKDTAQKFYDSGGKFENMSETEQARFMAAMVDAGAILAVPSNATREEWTQARNTYKEMQTRLESQYGEDIQDKISLYFGIDNTDEARAFLQAHPEVERALDDQTAFISNTPILMKFYGGIDTLERYYTGLMYDDLEAEYGEDILDIASGYYDLYDPADKRAYLKEHPELKEYWDDKAEAREEIQRKLVVFGDKLKQPEIQSTGEEPTNPTQEELQNFITPTPTPSFEEWQGIIGQPMSDLIQEYWYGDENLPREVISSLDFMASDYGFEDGDAMLRAILMSLENQ